MLFVVTRIAEIRFEMTARAILPWLISLLGVLAAITVFPPLTLWLPTAMRVSRPRGRRVRMAPRMRGVDEPRGIPFNSARLP